MYVMKLTGRRRIKNRRIRVVPLHEHIIAQGLLKW